MLFIPRNRRPTVCREKVRTRQIGHHHLFAATRAPQRSGEILVQVIYTTTNQTTLKCCYSALFQQWLNCCMLRSFSDGAAVDGTFSSAVGFCVDEGSGVSSRSNASERKGTDSSAINRCCFLRSIVHW